MILCKPHIILVRDLKFYWDVNPGPCDSSWLPASTRLWLLRWRHHKQAIHDAKKSCRNWAEHYPPLACFPGLSYGMLAAGGQKVSVWILWPVRSTFQARCIELGNDSSIVIGVTNWSLIGFEIHFTRGLPCLVWKQTNKPTQMSRSLALERSWIVLLC